MYVRGTTEDEKVKSRFSTNYVMNIIYDSKGKRVLKEKQETVNLKDHVKKTKAYFLLMGKAIVQTLLDIELLGGSTP